MHPENNAISPIYLVLTGIFICCLMISNIVAGRLVDLYGFTLTADLFLFPITYIFGDILTEVYGFRRARLAIWMGFGANLFMSAFFIFIVNLPHPDFFQDKAAYDLVLGFAPRVVVASLCAYFMGEFSNSVILSWMKLKTRGRYLWTRTIGSTLVGEGVDTCIFMTIAFAGIYSWPELLVMAQVQYFWKVAYEILATPLTYRLVGWIKHQEGVDVYDYDVAYNPFSLQLEEQPVA